MPVARPGLSARALTCVIAGLDVLGHDVQALLHASGIDLAAFENPEARLPHASALAFWERAVQLTRDEALALHVALAAPVESFDLRIHTVVASPTLRAGLERACRYQRLIHDTTKLELIEETGGARLRHSTADGRPVPRHSAEFLLAAYLRVARLASGTDFPPTGVRFAHPKPAALEPHLEAFAVTPSFRAGENSLSFSREQLDAPCPAANAGLLTVLEHHADDLLARTPALDSWASRVRAVVLPALADGAPNVADVARALGSSVRSLGRHLEGEGTTFSEVVANLRLERARQLLADSRTSQAEVAFLLGFSELSAFHRAFKRWTGQTPAEWRATKRS